MVVCASALVNAKPLTAATAMILLSMCASCGRFAKKFGGRRRAGVLRRERRNRGCVPGSRSHSRRDLHGSARSILHVGAFAFRHRHFARATDIQSPARSWRMSNISVLRAARSSLPKWQARTVSSSSRCTRSSIGRSTSWSQDLGGPPRRRGPGPVDRSPLVPDSKARPSRAPHGGDALELGVGSRLGRWFAWQARGGRNRRSSGAGAGFGNHSLSLSAVNDPEGRAPRDGARGAAR